MGKHDSRRKHVDIYYLPAETEDGNKRFMTLDLEKLENLVAIAKNPAVLPPADRFLYARFKGVGMANKVWRWLGRKGCPICYIYSWQELRLILEKRTEELTPK